MRYTQLLQKVPGDAGVRTGVIGTGHFATAVITQAESIPRLEVPAVADLDIPAARQAFRQAGVPEDAIQICDSRAAALRALEQGQRVIVQDALLLMELPLDVIVESTGVPEAGARHALAAIGNGKHVVMVNKETDATVGPILKQRADAAGVVYTQVDGDQHGLLIALVYWAQELGLEILCAGKARDAEFVHDRTQGTVSCGRHAVAVDPQDAHWLDPIAPGEGGEGVAARQRLLAALPQVGGFDLTEMAVVVNGTGLLPDVETLHCPALHTAEIPAVFCPADEGGILPSRGVIDAVTSLRYPEEAGLGGGVFIVVACHNDYSRHILATKGCLTNPRGTAALIYRPYHLCGVETPISILCAGLLRIATSPIDYRPHVDLFAQTTRALPAGTILGNDHSPDLQARIRPAVQVTNDGPLPFHMGSGRRLRVDVPAGVTIQASMVEPPTESPLWQLRQEQDTRFLGKEAMTNVMRET